MRDARHCEYGIVAIGPWSVDSHIGLQEWSFRGGRPIPNSDPETIFECDILPDNCLCKIHDGFDPPSIAVGLRSF